MSPTADREKGDDGKVYSPFLWLVARPNYSVEKRCFYKGNIGGKIIFKFFI